MITSTLCCYSIIIIAEVYYTLPHVKAHAQGTTFDPSARIQISNSFLLPSFALHCSQTEHAHKRLSIPHADTVTETGRQKFMSISTIYECVWERESKLCCYDSYQEKSLLSNITIKIDHHFEPKSMLCTHHRCFGSFVIASEMAAILFKFVFEVAYLFAL